MAKRGSSEVRNEPHGRRASSGRRPRAARRRVPGASAPPPSAASGATSPSPIERRARLGTKHTCYACHTKFYDLNRPEPICPKCGADQRDRPEEAKPAEAMAAAAIPPEEEPAPARAPSRSPALVLEDEETVPAELEDEGDLRLPDVSDDEEDLFPDSDLPIDADEEDLEE